MAILTTRFRAEIEEAINRRLKAPTQLVERCDGSCESVGLKGISPMCKNEQFVFADQAGVILITIPMSELVVGVPECAICAAKHQPQAIKPGPTVRFLARIRKAVRS